MVNGYLMSNYFRNKIYTIVVTGGSGRFGYYLKKIKNSHKIFFPNKKTLNILNTNSIEKYLKLKKPNILIHMAALSRPMNVHYKKIINSIDMNIIGTANVTKICSKLNIKLIYFSTNYVYPGIKGNYKETDPVRPINNYSWSKLGGECSVQMYKNSLVLRICMTEKPFIHKKAFIDVKTNFIFHENVARIVMKLLDQKGIINVGGPTDTVYNFAKKSGAKVRRISAKKLFGSKFPKNQSLNLLKLKQIVAND